MAPGEMNAAPDLARIGRAFVIRHRAGGDLLLSTPALRALRAGLPHARIEVLTARGMGELLRGNPNVDSILEFDRRSLVSQAALYARLLRGGYGLVLDMVSNPRSALMTALTRASVRVGYDLPGRAYAYTLRLPREPSGPSGPTLRYAPEAALDLVRALRIAPRGLSLTFKVAAEAREGMDAWLAEAGLGAGRPWVACLPSGSWRAKTWPPDRFAAVLDALSADADVVWIWGPGEREIVESCRSLMKRPSHVAPPTGWQELGGLLQRASLLLSNDSGPKHVAVALGVPTVTIFGPTHPATWHPPDGPHTALFARGLQCLHCNETVCPLSGERNMRCMIDLTVDQVLEACRRHLSSGVRGIPCESR